MHPQPTTLQEPYIMLSNSDGCYKVLLSEIIYCSSYNSSTQFHITGMKHIVTSCSISQYEKLFAPYGFLRIHQSTLINAAYLCHINKGDETNTVYLTTGQKLSMARTKKQAVMNSLRQNCVGGCPDMSDKGKTKPDAGKKLPDSQKLIKRRRK